MRARAARAAVMLFGLSLLLTACNVDRVLELVADLTPPPAEAAEEGAPSEPADDGAAPEDGAASEDTDDASDQAPTHRARKRTERRPAEEPVDQPPAADEDGSDDDTAEQPAERQRNERPRRNTTPPADSEEPAGGGQSGDLSGVEQQVFNLLNAERQRAGLSPLQLDSTLTQGSRAWSRRMATEGFFSHDTSGNFAENIAYGYPSPEAVHRGWMESEGHHDNRMNSRYTRYGIGAFEQGGTIYWTERFN